MRLPCVFIKMIYLIFTGDFSCDYNWKYHYVTYKRSHFFPFCDNNTNSLLLLIVVSNFVSLSRIFRTSENECCDWWQVRERKQCEFDWMTFCEVWMTDQVNQSHFIIVLCYKMWVFPHHRKHRNIKLLNVKEKSAKKKISWFFVAVHSIQLWFFYQTTSQLTLRIPTWWKII